MEYAILDMLWNASEEKAAEYQERTGTFFISEIKEVEEPFKGSSDTLRMFIFKNYVGAAGLMNLAIITREVVTNQKSEGGLMINNVETAIFPLYDMTQTAFDLPDKEPLPEIDADTIKFIVAKRSLPKKKRGEEFDLNKHKWQVNDIAKELHISNRVIAQYCRVQNI